jgi:uncharacterized membrane protein YedE/YeeE
MRRILYVLSGAIFGFLLHQGRVTDYDAIANMFLFREFQLMGVMGTAIATAAVGFAWLRRREGFAAASEFKPKALNAGVLAGSLLFGVGWALSGS